MALDNRFFTTLSLTEYIVDPITGEPVNGGVISFWKDTSRATPKLVYQLTGSPPNYTYSPLPNSMDIAVGQPVNEDGVPTAIYYYPYDELGALELYYVTIHNEAGDLIEQREAVPNITSGTDPVTANNNVSNFLSNSQFVDVLFNPDFGDTIEIEGSVTNQQYDIAPGWFLLISTNGDTNITINRTALAGSLNLETNPPYQLEVLASGGNLTSLKLVQRLDNNPGIWASQYLAAGLLVSSLDGINHPIQVIYSPSITTADIIVLSSATGQSDYVYLTDTVLLPPSDNTDNGDDGYVDIQIILPTTGEIAITSVQVVGMASNQEDVGYEQEPVDRQEDHLFHYYNPLIQQVPVPSILEGWDFKVNPAQLGETVSLGAIGSGSAYLWDQLIGWQNDSNILSVSRASTGDLNVNLSATGEFALIQYLGGTQLKEFLSNDFSVLMEGYSDQVAGASGSVSFWYTNDATLPNVAAGTNQSLIAALDANGKPTTFHGNWTELTRNYRGDGKFTIPYANAGFSNQYPVSSISLEGWNQTPFTSIETATYAAIVIGFASAPASNVVFKSISVTPGLLARPYAPLSYELTRKQLERYYEKSYNPGVYAGAVTALGQLSKPQPIVLATINFVSSIFANFAYTGNFGIEFKGMKRVAPVVSLYSPLSGAINTVVYNLTGVSNTAEAISRWTPSIGQYNANYAPADTTEVSAPGACRSPTLLFHYTADARLGIVL